VYDVVVKSSRSVRYLISNDFLFLVKFLHGQTDTQTDWHRHSQDFLWGVHLFPQKVDIYSSIHRLKLLNWLHPLSNPPPPSKNLTPCSAWGVHIQLIPINYAKTFSCPWVHMHPVHLPWLRLCRLKIIPALLSIAAPLHSTNNGNLLQSFTTAFMYLQLKVRKERFAQLVAWYTCTVDVDELQGIVILAEIACPLMPTRIPPPTLLLSRYD